MSFNIRCGDVGVQTAESRYTLVSDTIFKGIPDSVGIQEATPEWMEYLKTALSDKYDYVGIPREEDGEYSSIFYLKDKYSIVSVIGIMPSKPVSKNTFAVVALAFFGARTASSLYSNVFWR